MTGGRPGTDPAPGEQRTYPVDSAGWDWVARSGTRRVTAFVDDVGRITESREDDNTLTVTVTVA